MKRSGAKNAVAALITVVGAAGMVSCGGTGTDRFEPGVPEIRDTQETIHIAVDPESAEQWVLSKLYETVFDNRQRFAVLRLDPDFLDAPFGGLDEGTVDLVVGCTGAFLETVNPVLAEELTKEYVAAREQGGSDLNSGEWRDRTYAALLSSLPEHLAAGDPSNAESCGNANDLPQNVVPVFRKPAFVRSDREILNWVSGAITTGELEELVDLAREEGRSAEVVEAFIASKGG